MADGPKDLARRFYAEVINGKNVAVIDELVDDDLVEHQEMPGMPPGKAGVRAFFDTFHAAFPDLHADIQGIVSEGDEVWVYAVMTGTHEGEFLGIPATGKQISVTMVDRVRVRDGKAVEHWGVSDDLGMMTQLGVIPEMG
jgi:steroid delta-isomerase-like uncharacterized protein